MKRIWKKTKNKYGNEPRAFNGIRYDSLHECRYAQKLDFLQSHGEIDFWLRQVPFDLPGSTRYFLDFIEFWADGTIKFTECKGHWTEAAKIKFKQVQDIYGIEIQVIKK